MSRVLAWSRRSGGWVQAAADPVLGAHLAKAEAFRSAPCVLVLPPLWDHHGHVLWCGALLEQVDLRGCASLHEALTLLGAWTRSAPHGAWVEGFGWDQNLWGGHFPDRRDLDPLFPDTPVLLRRIDGHAAWVNSAALMAAGLGDSPADPPGGRCLREEGRLTGILLDQAMDLAAARMPPPEPAAIRRRILRTLYALKAEGLWGATDMGLEPAAQEALEALDREGALPAGVEGFIHVTGEALETAAVYEGGLFAVTGGKLFADGALGSRGAALREDYSDAPGQRGLLLRSTEGLSHAILSVLAHGLTPAIHAIGDRAADQVMDALEALGGPGPVRIEHAQTLDAEQVRRLAKLGVTASIQPCHHLSDKAWAGGRLGGRTPWAYRCGSLSSAGIPLLIGSDFPIEPHSPMRNFVACATRADAAERLSLSAVLKAYEAPAGRVPHGARTLVACEDVSCLEGGGGEAIFGCWEPSGADP